jgi:tellurite resistance-related uncharacterized protein
MNRPPLPEGLEHVRTTEVFDNATVPAGLLRAHRVAEGVWGRLVVHTGTVTFVFDDDPDHAITARAGDRVAIPPTRRHHLEVDEPATFAVEFHRIPDTPVPEAGTESSALDPGSGEADAHER